MMRIMERKHLRPRAALRRHLATAGVALVRLDLPAGDAPAEHDHDVIELAWIGRGAVAHRIGAAELPGPAGSLLVLPSARTHRYVVAPGGAELWNLLIDPARIGAPALPPPLARHLPALLPAAGGSAALIGQVPLAGPLAGLAGELAATVPGWVMSAGLHLRLVLLAAARAIEAGRARILPAGDPRIEALRQRIDGDPGRAWDLAAMGRIAGLGPAGLVRAFRRHTGLTPMAAVRAARLRLARALVADGHAVAAAAQAVGYNGASALAKACRAAGSPPPGRGHAAG